MLSGERDGSPRSPRRGTFVVLIFVLAFVPPLSFSSSSPSCPLPPLVPVVVSIAILIQMSSCRWLCSRRRRFRRRPPLRCSRRRRFRRVRRPHVVTPVIVFVGFVILFFAPVIVVGTIYRRHARHTRARRGRVRGQRDAARRGPLQCPFGVCETRQTRQRQRQRQRPTCLLLTAKSHRRARGSIRRCQCRVHSAAPPLTAMAMAAATTTAPMIVAVRRRWRWRCSAGSAAWYSTNKPPCPHGLFFMQHKYNKR